MKLQRLTYRSALILAVMLLGYGLVTVCLILASFLTRGSELAMLVAAGATSIAVPVGGLLALLVAWWQRTEVVPTEVEAPTDQKEAAISGRTPLVDRSIILVGNGYEHLSLEATLDALRIDTGPGGSSSSSTVNAKSVVSNASDSPIG